MGQCYTTELTLKNVDEAKLIEKTKEQFKAIEADPIWFSDIEHIIQFVFCKNCERCYSNATVEKLPEGGYYATADFDSSYNWHYSMIDWFEANAGEGSELWIYPDDGYSHSFVKDDKAQTDWGENEEDEKED